MNRASNSVGARGVSLEGFEAKIRGLLQELRSEHTLILQVCLSSYRDQEEADPRSPASHLQEKRMLFGTKREHPQQTEILLYFRISRRSLRCRPLIVLRWRL